MTRTEAPIVHEFQTQTAGTCELNHGDDNLPYQSSNTRQWKLNRVRIRVMVGSAIIQLPIWGFAMSYGVVQEYFDAHWTLHGPRSETGLIGMTFNGVMYLSMPFLFALFTKRWARYRQTAAVCGTILAGLSFLLSSFSRDVWHLIVTQGILAAFGCALIYSPATLSLGEWFNARNRAVAYGLVLSCKNITGSACPFLLRLLLDHYGLRMTIRIWAAIAVSTALPAIFLIPTHPSSLSASPQRRRNIPWKFLRHQTIYIYGIATIFQTSGYGIPQTYINSFAHEVTRLSQTQSTLLLTTFNIPGIISSSAFGYLGDKRRFSVSAATVTFIVGAGSALSAFLLWGLTSQGGSKGTAMLVLFSITFGFFSSGYSAIWGGVINEMEQDAAMKNETIDTGMIYGLLNGARGIGYVSGGLVGVSLLKAGGKMMTTGSSLRGFAYGTTYGPLILFTGFSSILGGWGLLWKCKGVARWTSQHLW